MNVNIKPEQELILKNREVLKINGVKKVESLNTYEFIVDTNLGKIQIKGNNLEMSALDIDKGTLNISGKIDSIEYSNKTVQKQKGFVAKLFK